MSVHIKMKALKLNRCYVERQKIKHALHWISTILHNRFETLVGVEQLQDLILNLLKRVRTKLRTHTIRRRKTDRLKLAAVWTTDGIQKEWYLKTAFIKVLQEGKPRSLFTYRIQQVFYDIQNVP